MTLDQQPNYPNCKHLVPATVLILDGSSELGAQEQSLLFDLSKAFDRQQSQIGHFFLPKKHIFLHVCETCSEVPFNTSTSVLAVQCTHDGYKPITRVADPDSVFPKRIRITVLQKVGSGLILNPCKI